MILEVILLLCLAALLIYKATRKPDDLPPGSFGLPVLGNLPPQDVNISEHFKRLRDKYGNIFTTKWGSRVIVVMADLQIIKKAQHHVEFQNRNDFYSYNLFNLSNDKGIINSHGKIWIENRRFMIRHLRDLGMGKTRLEYSIQEEAKMLVEYLEENCLNKPTEMDWSINVAVLNVIWQLLANKRYAADDAVVRDFSRKVNENIQIMQGPMFLLDVMPWLVKVVPQFVMNKWMQADVMKSNSEAVTKMFQETVDDHKKALNPDDPIDVLDFYLLEVEKNRGNPDALYNDSPESKNNLSAMMMDMFLGGSDTTSSTLRWSIVYLANRPQIQKKAQQILDDVVPKDRLPSLDDRHNLAYIDAVILDTLRLSSILPTATPRCASSTVQFEGYTVPKGTMILLCLELCHHDPDLWEQPLDLFPEHFLDSEGKLESKKEGWMPFGNGRHHCPGESLARMEEFLFLSAILQRFHISPPPGVTLTEDADPSKKIMHHPLPFKVVLTKRI